MAGLVAGTGRATSHALVSVERELIAAAQQGDREAFRRLYLDNVAPIHRYLRRRVPAEDAEDLTAETFGRAWEHLGRYEDRGRPFVAWLYRIAGNLVASRARRHAVLDVDASMPDDIPVTGFEDALLTDLESAALRQSLAALPDRQRAVLELRFLRQHSVAETGTALGIGDDAVRALTYRSLRMLRVVIEKEAGR